MPVVAATTPKSSRARKATTKRASARKRAAPTRAEESSKRARYAAYLRISKDPSGTSTAPDRQLRDIRTHAKLHDYDIVEVYKDSDLSAYKKDVVRPAYEDMLDAMEEGAIDGVVVWKLDRLIRRITEFSRFWEIADRTGTALVSVKDAHVDTRQPIGVGIVYLLVSLAEQEAYTMGMRIQAKKAEEARGGERHSGGRRGYGMDSEGNIIESEAEIIREAAARALAGENLGHIARDFNRREIPTATGRRWARRTVHVLLQQARLFGWREYKGELIAKGEWAPIIDEATGRRLREILPKITPNGQGEPAKRVHLLSGVLRCRICDRSMRGGYMTGWRVINGVREPNNIPCYRCPPLAEGGCSRTSIARDPVDEFITEMILMRLDSPAVRNALNARGKKKGGNDAKLLADLQRYTTKLEHLAADYAADRLSRVGHQTAVAEVERHLAEVNNKLARSAETEPLADLLKAPGGISAAWERLSLERKQAIIRVMLEKVYVHQIGSEYYAKHIRESLLMEADELEAAGDLARARKRRRQAENPKAAGNQTRPERLEPVWSV